MRTDRPKKLSSCVFKARIISPVDEAEFMTTTLVVDLKLNSGVRNCDYFKVSVNKPQLATLPDAYLQRSISDTVRQTAIH